MEPVSIMQEKQELFLKVLWCQECLKPNAIHIFVKSIQCRNCSKIPGFPACKVSLLRP